jgi:hypothetical protein
MRGSYRRVLTDRLLFWFAMLLVVIALAAQLSDAVSPPPG